MPMQNMYIFRCLIKDSVSRNEFNSMARHTHTISEGILEVSNSYIKKF